MKPHGTHGMWTIATDDPVAWCICLSVYHALRHAKTTAERIDALCRVETLVGHGNIFSDGGPDSPRREEVDESRCDYRQITSYTC